MSKFFGVNSDYIKNDVYSLKTYKGATKVGGKIKFGGAEHVENQFVIDAIDIDWGGLSLTSIYDKGTTSAKGTKNIELHKIDSNDENQNRSEIGISSTGYALAKLSDSFTNIVGVIGAQDTDTGTVRKRVADLEASVKTLTGNSSSSIADVVNKINRIEKELTENPNVNDWVTWVDSLKSFDKGANVKNYIDNANSELTKNINKKANQSDVNTISTNVTNLQNIVGTDAEKGLRKDVANLKNTVGDASSGLVLKVNTNSTQIANLNNTKANQSDVDTISTNVTGLQNIVGTDDTKGLRKKVADLNTNKANQSEVNTISSNVNSLQNIVGTDDTKGLRKKVADLNTNKADKTTVSGISTKVGTLETTVGNASSGLVKKVADLETNKADNTTVNSLLSAVYQNGNTTKPSYIQAYAIPAYNIAWENKTAIENLKTSGISATRMVDADGNGILVYKSLSTN